MLGDGSEQKKREEKDKVISQPLSPGTHPHVISNGVSKKGRHKRVVRGSTEAELLGERGAALGVHGARRAQGAQGTKTDRAGITDVVMR